METVDFIYRGHYGLSGKMVEVRASEHHSHVIAMTSEIECDDFAYNMLEDIAKKFVDDRLIAIEYTYRGVDYISES